MARPCAPTLCTGNIKLVYHVPAIHPGIETLHVPYIKGLAVYPHMGEIIIFTKVSKSILAKGFHILFGERVFCRQIIHTYQLIGEHFVESPSLCEAGKPRIGKMNIDGILYPDMGVRPDTGRHQEQHQCSKN